LTPPNHGSLLWHFSWPPVAGLALFGTGLGRGESEKRRVMGFFVACCLFAGLIAQSACGGSSSPKAQTYTVSVTATSGTTQRSTTVTLTVH
jgi:hypothetical protein